MSRAPHSGYEEIWRFIRAKQGRRFTAADVAKALPLLSRSYIRNRLYHLVRDGRLWATPDTWSFIYAEALQPGQEPAELPGEEEAFPGALAVAAFRRIGRLPRAPVDDDEAAQERASDAPEPKAGGGNPPICALALEPEPCLG